jgi:hypothetical protein
LLPTDQGEVCEYVSVIVHMPSDYTLNVGSVLQSPEKNDNLLVSIVSNLDVGFYEITVWMLTLTCQS